VSTIGGNWIDLPMWPRAGLLCLLIAVAMPSRAEPDAVGAWQKQIATRLSASFPPQATAQTGTVTVGFVLDRSGKLIWNVVLQSSGFKALDVEAVAIVDRAQPFPAPPPNIDDGKLKIVADLVFPSTRDVFKEDAALHAKLRGVCRGC
jgi:periplasmic protein TonB